MDIILHPIYQMLPQMHQSYYKFNFNPHYKSGPTSISIFILIFILLIGRGTEDIVRRYPHPSRLFLFCLHLFDSDPVPISTSPPKQPISVKMNVGFDANMGPQSAPGGDVLDVEHVKKEDTQNVKKEDAVSVSTPGIKKIKKNCMNSNNMHSLFSFLPLFFFSSSL